jgi:hypothetical protein
MALSLHSDLAGFSNKFACHTGKSAMSKNPDYRKSSKNQDHRKIAEECAKAAAEVKSIGDREQLLQIQQKHLDLAKREAAVRPKLGLKFN